ncbi:MAG TPA: sugar phosphate isomerase/epimerase [Candidatus Aminicenantes bacterium]|nr:sugar phosphate isomerase/epimerase [Candidatus Aminicenantes bacterium]HRY64957.1 sugar phosphate isomerase/epimerase [Candidatus Aminicenantes bacterium]HRZ71870.1 sugar phosphate isomerase/epimerase [Candidatus Aminicenantes bacterium]
MSSLTRRGFLGSSLAAAAALGGAAAERGGGRPGGPAPGPRFELGLASYTCREFDLDATLAMARRVGLGRIALKDMHLPLDSPDEAIRTVIAKTRAAGLVPYGCGVVYMASEAEVDRAFAYARTGGFEIIIGVPEHALLDRVERRVRETGIRLAIHNHGPGDLRYPTPGSVLERIAARDPRIGVCFDAGHCARAGLDPSAEAVRCGPRLLDVHMKDVSAATTEGGAVEVGRGVINIPGLLRALAEIGYAGTLAFEHEKDGRDPLPGLAESVGYVRGAAAALKL